MWSSTSAHSHSFHHSSSRPRQPSPIADAERRRYYEILGPPAPLKQSVVLEGGHVPQDMRGLVCAVLDWYDSHLGVVN
jgi:hypothetical protein